MNIISVCAAAVIASILAVVLKKSGAEYSFILTICAVCLILAYILVSVVASLTEIESVFAKSGITEKYIVILLKCVGICFLTEFSCDCCKDASQSALASVVLVSGRICVLITALPLFEEFLNLTLLLSGGGT